MEWLSQSELNDALIIVVNVNGPLKNVKELRALGARACAFNSLALAIAAQRGNLGMVRLLTRGPDAARANDNGSHALTLAAERGDLAMMKFLRTRPENPARACDNDSVALCFAAKEGHAAAVEALLKGADAARPRATDSLAWAATAKVARILIEHGAVITQNAIDVARRDGCLDVLAALTAASAATWPVSHP
jgi:ankyrin repeat protein